MEFAQLYGSVVIRCPECGVTFKKRLNPIAPWIKCTNCQATYVPGVALWRIKRGQNRKLPCDQMNVIAGWWSSSGAAVNRYVCESCGIEAMTPDPPAIVTKPKRKPPTGSST